jgi:hypothetical protein
MSQSSIRLGIILIGLGLLLWGLHIQSKYEGFQVGPTDQPPTGPPTTVPPVTAMTPPTVPPLTSTPTTEAAPDSIINSMDAMIRGFDYTTLSNYQIEDLRKKVLEIKTKYDLIMKIKLAADIKLTALLSDTDTITKINIIYSEIKSFLNNFGKINIEKIINNTSYVKEKDIVTQLIYSTYDQVTLLYRIYYTIPSLIISSGAIVSADTATSMTILDDDVLAKAAAQISMEVSGIPSAIEQISSVTTVLTKSANDLLTNYSDTTLGKFQEFLTKYLMIVDLEISNLDLKISNMSSTKSDVKLKNLLNTKVLFLNSVLSTLKSIHDILNKVKELNVGVSSNIQTTITSYDSILQTTKEKLIPKEGFQSYGNSYNTPSPNITQAHEFRLGKRQYVDDVFSGIKIFM